MAVVQPLRCLRYDERRAGRLEDLVAPPYDVLDPEQRAAYRAKSPYNVVHLTLPDSEQEAAGAFAEWRHDGVLVGDDEPAFWALVQDYVGPDGVPRTRTGLVAALRLEPYETRVVLPHERTHRGPKEGRLRLLRAVRAQLEPIFLLYDGEAPFAVPERDPDVEADGARLWRIGADSEVAAAFADRQLLIADGHHRYETALAFHAEDGTEASAYMMVVLVSTSDPRLTIFPTHRVFAAPPATKLEATRNGDRPESALRALEQLPPDRPAAVLYEKGRAALAVGTERELDVQLVDRLGHEGISYTPDWREAVRRVDAGEAVLAALLRPTRIEDVFTYARRGETLPQKTTYFYPKLLSGLLFQPL